MINMKSTIVAILVVAVVAISSGQISDDPIGLQGNFLVRLGINGVSKFPIGKNVTSQWVTTLSPHLDVRYHFTFHNERNQWAVKEQFRLKDKYPSNKFDGYPVWGWGSIQLTTRVKRADYGYGGVREIFTPENNYTRETWLNIELEPPYSCKEDMEAIRRDKLLTPKYWDSTMDRVVLKHYMSYVVNFNTREVPRPEMQHVELYFE